MSVLLFTKTYEKRQMNFIMWDQPVFQINGTNMYGGSEICVRNFTSPAMEVTKRTGCTAAWTRPKHWLEDHKICKLPPLLSTLETYHTGRRRCFVFETPGLHEHVLPCSLVARWRCSKRVHNVHMFGTKLRHWAYHAWSFTPWVCIPRISKSQNPTRRALRQIPGPLTESIHHFQVTIARPDYINPITTPPFLPTQPDTLRNHSSKIMSETACVLLACRSHNPPSLENMKLYADREMTGFPVHCFKTPLSKSCLSPNLTAAWGLEIHGINTSPLHIPQLPTPGFEVRNKIKPPALYVSFAFHRSKHRLGRSVVGVRNPACMFNILRFVWASSYVLGHINSPDPPHNHTSQHPPSKFPHQKSTSFIQCLLRLPLIPKDKQSCSDGGSARPCVHIQDIAHCLNFFLCLALPYCSYFDCGVPFTCEVRAETAMKQQMSCVRRGRSQFDARGSCLFLVI